MLPMLDCSVNAVLDVIEASYHSVAQEDDWLRGVGEAFNTALGDGSGTLALVPSVTRPGPRFERALGVGMGPWWRQQVDALEGIPEKTYRAFSTAGVVYFWSQIQQDISTYEPEAARYFEDRAREMFGMTDTELFDRVRRGEKLAEGIPIERLGIGCIDANGHGVGVIIPRRLLADRPIQNSEALTWGRVAAHIAAATRLRRLKRSGQAAIEAVLDPGGKVLHAEPAAVNDCDALRRAAIAQDRVRSRRNGGLDAVNATAQWRALIAGRWSLVDEFESDGRRFLVARPNTPTEEIDTDLSQRESLVARAVSLGHSNKQIAYELGITTSTVAGHLRGAMLKLGAHTRTDLVRAVNARNDAGR